MPILRVLAWNVLYGGAGREQRIGAVIRTLHPDIAVFTEARATRAFDSIADLVGPYRVRSGRPDDRECVVIASRWPIVRSDSIGPSWAPAKWAIATMQPHGTGVTVAGVHLTPQPLWPFELLRRYEVREVLKRLAGEGPHLVAGDFNTMAAGDEHGMNRAPSWVRGQLLLQAGMTPRWALGPLLDAGYVDSYRACNPSDHGFTVPAWDPQVRIDYLFASRELAPALRAASVATPVTVAPVADVPRRSLGQLLGRVPVSSLNGEASDHLPVWADFEWGASV